MFSNKWTARMSLTILLVFALVSTMVVFGAHSLDTEGDLLNLPYGLAYSEKDSALIIADSQNHRIITYKLDWEGITEIVGLTEGEDRFGQPGGGYVDGSLAGAMFNHPRGVAVADNGAIFVADTGNHAIRQILGNQVTTIAGGKVAGFKDGVGGEASFLNPSGLAIDSKGDIYVADTLNNAIRKIDQDGKVTTVYGGGKEKGLKEPTSLVIDKDGNIYVTDGGNHQIKMINPKGELSLVAGKSFPALDESGYSLGGYLDGKVSEAEFSFPKGLALKADGTVLVADSLNHLIRGVKGGSVFTVAGVDSPGDAFTDRFVSFFDEPMGLAYGDSSLFVADSQNNRIVVIPDKENSLSKPMAKVKQEGEVVVFLDGKEVIFPDTQAFVAGDDELMVPIRFVAEKWGAQVGWDNDKRMVSVIKDQEEKQEKIELYFSKGDFILLKGRSLASFDVFEEKFGFYMRAMAGGEVVIIESN